MSAPKWTPGQWKMDGEGLFVWAEGTTMKVCDIRGWGYLTGKGLGALGLDHAEGEAIQRANGALIAAAPDLYEALEKVMLAHASDLGGGFLDADEFEEIQSALAKARGES